MTIMYIIGTMSSNVEPIPETLPFALSIAEVRTGRRAIPITEPMTAVINSPTCRAIFSFPQENVFEMFFFEYVFYDLYFIIL